MDLLWRALTFFRPDLPRIWAGLGLLLLNSALALLKPWPLALAVDALSSGRVWEPLAGLASNRSAYLGLLVVGLVLLSLGHAVGGGLQQAVVIGTGLRGLARVRQAVFDWLLRLSLRRLQGSPSGDLIYRATWDTYAFQTLFTQGLFVFAGAVVSVLAMTVVMWRVNPALTGVALATVPVLLAVMRGFGPRLSERASAAQAADAGVATGVQQTMTNLLLIQSYTRESEERAGFGGKVADALSARWRQHRAEVVYLGVVAAVLGLGSAALVGVGVRQVEAQRLSLGELLVFLAYLTQLYEPLNQLSHVGATVSNARAGARRVIELLDDGPAEPVLKPAASPPPTRSEVAAGGIQFDGVSFAYQAGRPVLNALNLDVAPGEVLALIGPSGSGKTTLLQMIPRFLDPDAGSLHLGGRELRSWPLAELRRNIALVPQEPLLLPTTVAENIGYGRAGASRAEIEAAARAAHADGFIDRLPRGYDTVIGDGATRLSVGEKQRLNLARAFLKDAPILLLDEPTSALDAESEQAVLAGLRRLVTGRTVLVVAHRLVTLREVHRIAVLNEGRIAEIGTPTELLARSGYFARVRGQTE